MSPKPDGVAGRRAIHFGILPSADLCHRSRSLEAAFPCSAQRLRLDRFATPASIGKVVQTDELACAAKLRQNDFLCLARCEPHRRSCGNIQVHAEGFTAVELQRFVGFEKMVVAADLNGPVAGVDDLERNLPSAGVDFDLALFDDELTRFDRVACAAFPCSYRIMDRDEFCAVRKSAFHLNHRHKKSNARHNVISRQDRRTPRNQVCY